MSHSDFRLFGRVHKLAVEEGTGDGTFAVFYPCPKIIRGKKRKELIGRNTETPVSPVPRPLASDASEGGGRES